jgi:hypothetical protein
MTVLKPRSRMISVRLSEDEYESLRRLCTLTGARSVSDLTRDAMQILLNSSSRENALSSYLDDFRSQISTLDRKIEELSIRMTPSKTEVEN